MKKNFLIKEDIKREINLNYDDVMVKKKVDERSITLVDSEKREDKIRYEEFKVFPSYEYVSRELKKFGFEAKKLLSSDKSETYSLEVPEDVKINLHLSAKITDPSIIMLDKNDNPITKFSPDKILVGKNVVVQGCKIIVDEIVCELEMSKKDIKSIIVERDPESNFMFIELG